MAKQQSKKSKVDSLRILYHDISESLSTDELRSLKNLVRGKQITKRKLEQLHTAEDIFIELEENGSISKTDLTLLKDLLGIRNLNRRPLIDLIEKFESEQLGGDGGDVQQRGRSAGSTQCKGHRPLANTEYRTKIPEPKYPGSTQRKRQRNPVKISEPKSPDSPPLKRPRYPTEIPEPEYPDDSRKYFPPCGGTVVCHRCRRKIDQANKIKESSVKESQKIKRFAPERNIPFPCTPNAIKVTRSHITLRQTRKQTKTGTTTPKEKQTRTRIPEPIYGTGRQCHELKLSSQEKKNKVSTKGQSNLPSSSSRRKLEFT